VPWSDITSAPATLWRRLLPPEAALAGWPTVRLDARGAQAFTHGQCAGGLDPASPTRARHVIVRDPSDRFLGVGETVDGTQLVKPSRLLHADRPRTDVLPA
jgi:tRNA pseudouridine55 synthase